MKRTYRISEKALQDLEKILFYTIENWSISQAERYYATIISEIEYLSNHFEDGNPMDHIKIGYRMAKVKSHLIFYRQQDEFVIEIIRILHQQMDLENRLSE